MRWIKQKTIQKSPFEAHLGRLPKTEFKIMRDKFVEFSDHLDKQHLERSALTANQLKKSIDQSRDSLKIVKKGQKSRDVSPLFEQDNMSTQEKNPARTLRTLLEANANWNAQQRRYDGPSLQQLVDATNNRRDETRKSGAALTKPFKGKVRNRVAENCNNSCGSSILQKRFGEGGEFSQEYTQRRDMPKGEGKKSTRRTKKQAPKERCRAK